MFLFSVVRKIAQYLGDVLEDEKDKLKESLVVNGRKSSHFNVLCFLLIS